MDNILWTVMSEIENGTDVKTALDKGVQQLNDEM
jgi:hypothetical protein